eukprot:2531433-Lingulodinium_polyedra.AAC.1
MLSSRGTLHQCRAMFNPDPADRKIRRTQAKIGALQKLRPGHVGAKGMLLSDALKQATSMLPPGQKLTKEMVNQIVKEHGKRFKALTPEEQLAYHRRAAEHAESKAE